VTDHPSEPAPGSNAADPAHPTDPTDAADQADEAGVRRLLAEARHDEPMPPAVAARLEDVLAGLRDGATEPAEAADPAPSADVADLGARRRRATRLLLAAAAAVVVGVGVGVVHDHGIGLGPSGGSAGSASSDGSTASGDRAGAEGGGTSAYLSPALGRPVPLTPSRFAQQVRRLQGEGRIGALTGRPAGGPSGPAPTDGAGPRPARDGSSCVPGGVRGAALLPVRYGADPGLLAFRPPAGDTQVVELYLCGQAHPVRSATLPAR
jgi:hypothetical protein